MAEVIASDQLDPDSTPGNNTSVEDDQATATALVSGTVTLLGTDNDDTFEFTAGEAFTALVNGIAQALPTNGVVSVAFDGGAGEDTAVLRGTLADEMASLHPTSATFTGLGFEVQLANTEEITVFSGGGSDVVFLYDSPGDDNFVGTPTYAALYGDGFYNRARFFAEVHVEAAADGVDVARLYDSPGNDEYVAKPDYNAVSGAGVLNEARHFEGTHVYATAGGVDEAKFYDSVGNDDFVATPTYAALFGNGFYNRAKYFETVCGYATVGGTDLARFYDSPADDQFTGTPTYAALYNETYRREYTSGFHNEASSFEGAHAYATAGGRDVAKFYDSPGNDVFYSDPIQGALYIPGEYYNRAKFFEGVHAYATDDGTDVARFHGSDGDDTFYQGVDECAMYISGKYYNRAKYCEENYAQGHGGEDDRAELHDSALDDLLEAEGDWIRLTKLESNSLSWVSDCDYVRAIGTTGTNAKDTKPSLDFTLELEGTWHDRER